MSRSLRGLNAGLQTGLQLGSALRGVRQQQTLADESARYNVTEGAYGEDLNQNIEQVRGLMAEAQRQAAAQGGTVEDMARIEREYMPSIEELQRRAQMSAPDYTVASRAMRPEDTFATREEATRAARPMRAEGLANVYEEFGDIDKAEDLRERADTARARDLQMRGLERTEREAEGMQMAQQLLAGAEQAGQPITSEFLRVVASQTGANYAAVVDSAAKAIGFKEASATAALNELKRDLSKAATSGVSGLNKFLADKFDPDETDDIKPEVTKDAKGNFVVTYGGQVLPQYGANRSLEELVARTQGNIDGDPLGTVKTLLDIELRRAQIREANARTEGLGREKLTTQERNIAALERLGIPVSDADKRAIFGIGATGLSPARAAQEKVLLEQAKNLPPGDSKAGQALMASITQLYTDQATETRSAEVVESVSAAHKQGRGADALAMLRRQGFAESSVKSIADRAGVPYTPPPAGATPAEADTPTQPGLARQPVQLLSPLYRAQDWARRQNELNAQQFDPGFNPYGGGLR
jgi:hypothetical protein